LEQVSENISEIEEEVKVQAEALEKVTLEVENIEKAITETISNSDEELETKAISATNGINGNDDD